MARAAEADIIIKAAAVADYTVDAAAQKMKRSGPRALELQPTTDILAELGAQFRDKIIIGFAAETNDVLANARKKLEKKNVDAIVANDVSRKDIGFDAERNAVTIITRDEQIEVPEADKWVVAQRVLDAVVRIRERRRRPLTAGKPE
jgi:phosphopantothenoylcysteine decarboxylase/phosphopantothenate--cysteine ligase